MPKQFANQIPTRRRSGIVFRPGDYSDKGIGVVTVDDLAQIAEASQLPVPFNCEHDESLFDGCLGQAFNFRVGYDDGGEAVLMADWDEPEPLAQLLGNRPRRCSVEFEDWGTRTITGIALAKYPRVDDAAFFKAIKSAYAQFSAGKPVQPLGFAYESTDERDAIDPSDFADPANKLFPIRTTDELRDAMRQVWHAADPTAVKANIMAIAERKKFRIPSWPWSEPGMSSALPDPEDYSDYYFTRPHHKTEPGSENLDSAAQFADNKNHSKEGQMPNDSTQTAQADAAQTQQAGQAQAIQQAHELGLIDKMKAFFGWTPEQTAAAQAAVSKPPEVLRLEAELRELQNAHFSAQKGERDARAKQLAEKLLKENRILPYEVEAVAVEFSRALDDDARTPAKIAFSTKDAQGQAQTVEMSRAERLEALYNFKPAHNLTNEMIREFPAESIALFNQEATKLRNPGQDGEVDEKAVQTALSQAGGLGNLALQNMNNGNGAAK